MHSIKNWTIAALLWVVCGAFSCQATEAPHRAPILTTTAIIEVYKGDEFQGIVLIERGKAPWGKALPGGKVEYGETVENAVRREMMEEVNLDLHDLQLFGVYSDPARDYRHHSVEITHVAKAFMEPIAGDDAAQAWIVRLEDIPWDELAFDHGDILRDYLALKSRGLPSGICATKTIYLNDSRS